MTDAIVASWQSLRAVLTKAFPQLTEVEPGGALTMELGPDGWLYELTPDGRVLCQYGISMDDVKSLMSDGTTEDLGTDELAKQAKYFIQPAVSKYRQVLLQSGFSEQTDMNDEFVAVTFERKMDLADPANVQGLTQWCVRTIGR
ncbi:MAG: hypothetical protein U0412_06305 [Nitrospira sp.]